ncbi:MAG: replicative DNA helicase [Acholeplasmataceae bacterium]
MSNKLPNSNDTEKSVLGAILLDNKTAPNVFDEIRENDFFFKNHQLIYQAMKDLYFKNQEIDYTSLSSVLTNKGQLETVGGITTLIELSEYTVSLEHLETYISIIQDLSLKREIINTTQSLATKGFTDDLDTDSYLNLAEEQILSLSQKRNLGGFKTTTEVVGEYRDKLDYLKDYKGSITGLKTGFTTLDNYIHGLQKEELIILAARPSVGKTALAINIAINAAMSNKESQAGVAFFSLEMSNEQLLMRMLSSLTNIEMRKLRTGSLNQNEWRHLEVFTDKMKQLNIYFDDATSYNINHIRAKSRKLALEGKLDLVVVDYLQLVSADRQRGGTRQEEVSTISRALKQMARELKVPVIALSQLSRKAEDDKVPMLSHLRESGSIEQDADIVLFIHRDDYFEKDRGDQTSVDAQIIIAKNRQGALGNIDLFFSPRYSRFMERSKVEEQTN